MESRNKLEQETATLNEQIKKLREELTDKASYSNEAERAVNDEKARLEGLIESLNKDMAEAKEHELALQTELNALRAEIESSKHHHESDKIRFREREEELSVRAGISLSSSN